jgi:FLVCR family MFS transporter 7
LFVLLAPWIRQRRVPGTVAHAAVDWRRLLGNRTLLLQFTISFLQQGVFSAIATALEIVWSTRGFSSQQAGLANGLFIFGGMAGSFLLPAMQDRLCSARALLIVCYSTALLLSWPLLVTSSLLQGCVIAFVVGAFWLGSVPVALVMIERAAGAEHAGAASSAFWAFGSGGAVVLVWVFALLTQIASWQAGTVAMLVLLVINLGATFALPRSGHA